MADTNNSASKAKTWKRFVLNRWFFITVSVITLYALAGFLLVPWLVSHYVGQFATEKLERKATIAEVHFNPFLFKFEAKGLSFEEADGRPIAGFDRLFIDFELSSLFKWAWTFADIQIEKPSVYMEIGKDGRFNFQKISDSLPKSDTPPPPEDGDPPRLIVQHAEMINGVFRFSDQSAFTPVTKTFESLNLEFKNISTLPDRKGPYVIEAGLPDGGVITWQGEISLQPIFSEGEISISGFKVATVWEFVQDQLNLEKPAGEIGLSTRYRFDYQNGVTQLISQNGKLSLNGLSLTEKDTDKPMISLAAVDVDGASFDLHEREILIPSFSIKNGQIATSVNDNGMLNWQNIAVSGNAEGNAPSDHKVSAPDDHQPWLLKINGISLSDLSLDYTDHSRLKPFSLAVGGLRLFLTASAELGAGPVKALVEELSLDLNDIAITEIGKEAPVFSLASVHLDDSRVDVTGQSVFLSRIAVNGGQTSIVRNKEGQFPVTEFLAARKNETSDPDTDVPDPKPESEGNGWAFSLGEFELDHHEVRLQADDVSPSVVYNLKDIRTVLKSIRNDGKTPIDFEAAFNVGPGGNASFNGRLSQSADDIEAAISLSDISLKPLRPLLNEFTYLNLESGNVSVSSKLSYTAKKSGPKFVLMGLWPLTD